jgi:Spy/CpxP family protein refolding chaperone
MRKRTIASLCLVGLAVCALGAAAAPRMMAGDGEARPLRMFIQGQLGRLMTLRSELDVTSEQRGAIKKIVQSHRPEIVTVAKPIVEQRRALRDATLAKETNEAAIRAAANDLGKAIGDAAVLASKVKDEVGHVLTPEQMHKVEAFRLQSDNAVDGFIEKFAEQ